MPARKNRRSGTGLAGASFCGRENPGTVPRDGTAGEKRAVITLFERDVVADFGAWRKAFDDFAPTLKASGVVASAVYQSVDDANDITVAHEFQTLEDARAFLDSNELRAARPGAGVTDSPTVWFTRRV